MTLTERLEQSARFGIKPGLATVRTVLAACGDPQERLSIIHVAGTNGKGATCAIVDAALRQAGFRTGRYTSPHLVNLNERFFFNGKPVKFQDLERAWQAVEAVADTTELTYFEILTVVAFRYYADIGVDWLVLETGLGGRLDATNVISHPAVTAITHIGLDHCEWLGNTITLVAKEKAGIIKAGVPVVCGEMPIAARMVIAEIAKERGAAFTYAPELVATSEVPSNFPLKGSFNQENALTALAILRTLKAIGTSKVNDSLAALSPDMVIWPGRFQRVGKFLIDGAHNPPALTALVTAIKAANLQVDAVVCGFCGDKDVTENLRLLRGVADTGFAVTISNPRSLNASATAIKMREAGFVAEACNTLSDALQSARKTLAAVVATDQQDEDKHVILICGSLFLAGDALLELGAYPWPMQPRTPNETMVQLSSIETTEKLYPLIFCDNQRYPLWGTEQWIVSGHPVLPSVVANGSLAGRTLIEITQIYGRALTGTASPSSTAFPLLFKIIEARERLSVQVHPNDANAHLTNGEPKMEMWYILGEFARVWAGFRPQTTKADILAAMNNKTVGDLIMQHEIAQGEVILIPGGMVHAIGEGARIFEVQQSSDTTYRLYDWDRNGADGKTRELHIDASLKTIDLSLSVQSPRREIVCPYFRFEPLPIVRKLVFAADPRTFRMLYVATGSVRVDWTGGSLALSAGGCVLLPASVSACVIPVSEALLLKTSLV